MNEGRDKKSIILFNDVEYWSVAKIKNIHEYFYKYSKKSYLFIAFAIDENKEAISLPNSTFAGFESNSNPSPAVYDEFINRFCEDLKCKEVNGISIHLPPLSNAYFNVSEQYYFLVRNSFIIKKSDLSYVINVDDHDFEAKIDYANLKRLKRLRRELVFSRPLDISNLELVYSVIKSNRQSRGYELSLNYEDVKTQIQCLCKHILFGVFSGDHIIASAICVHLTSDVLYVMYWGELAEFKSLSPIIILAECIYNYSRENNIKFIDIGTSTINTQANAGLMKFKFDLGFKPHLKFVMRKELL
jgi:hypothetical protein